MEFVQFELQKLRQLPAAIDLQTVQPISYHLHPVIINRQTMHILNKYVIYGASADDPYQLIPCLLISVDPDHEIAAAIEIGGGIEGGLIARPADQATTDQIAAYIVRLFNANDREHLYQMGQDMDYYRGFIEWLLADDEPETDDPAAPANTPPDYKLTGEFDIPEIPLSAAPAYRLDNVTWHAYGSAARTRKHEAIHFYVDDSKFRGLTLEKLTATGCQVIVEPNYSANAVYPKALALADIYRKRRIAADAAAAGISVIVDLNVSRAFFDIALLGVPAGYTAYANRHYREDSDHLYEAYSLARQYAARDIDYYVIGGGATAELCAKNGWIWINSQEASGWDNGKKKEAN